MTDSESFRIMEQSIQSVTPDAIVAPYLVVVVTDSRHYAGVSNSVFRFLPVQLTSQDLERIHGTGERIAIRNYARAIQTYRQIVINAAGHRVAAPGNHSGSAQVEGSPNNAAAPALQ